MTTDFTPMDRTDASSVEAALLARLGLPSGASSQDVEVAHDTLVTFLEQAPTDLQGWARRQIGLTDEAYALLSDPTIDRSALADGIVAAGTQAPATKSVNAAKARGAAVESAPRPAAGNDNRLIKRLAIGAAAIVGVVAIVVAGFNLNGGTGVPPIDGSPAPEAAASAGVDQAQVAALMQKIQADPKDIDSLQSLADVYYLAGDFASAGAFLEKIVAIDAKNVTALLALGAAQFNLGDAAGAEKLWLEVAAIDPKNVEAHYDLGFMYLSQDPPDMANVRLQWGKVIEIDPDSDVAKTVATHLDSLAPSPAPGASGAPASAAPSASPAASPAPSGN